MTQFIQYLYEYENGERVRNLGFMKVESKIDKMEIQIYAKQVDEISGIWFEKEDGTHYIATWKNPEMKDEVQQVTEQIPEEKSHECVQDEQIVESEASAPSCICEKIQRQDLSRLPRREWKLANNNFLLHGYYNYHHLLYIEEKGNVWIGVPGVFHPREQMAAESFGFAEFRRLSDMQTESVVEEANTEEDFGYWCRQVEHF